MPNRREWWALLTHRPAAAVLAGLASGAVIGGIGGRLAMLVLRLTSAGSVKGIESDDGFTIGSVTTDTFFLVVFAALAGAFLAIGYLIVRRWLPERGRPLLAAVLFGLGGGALVIEPEGVDFTVLGPKPLAVAMFIALPAAYGAAMVAGTEWLIADPDRLRRARVLALVPAVALLGSPLAVVAILAVGAVLAVRRWPAVAEVVTAPTVTWVMRTGLLALAVIGAVALTADVGEIV